MNTAEKAANDALVADLRGRLAEVEAAVEWAGALRTSIKSFSAEFICIVLEPRDGDHYLTSKSHGPTALAALLAAYGNRKEATK